MIDLQEYIALVEAKARVDSQMTYEYCRGWDCPANCVAFARAYRDELFKHGMLIRFNICETDDGQEHANIHYKGYVLDNRFRDVVKVEDEQCTRIEY